MFVAVAASMLYIVHAAINISRFPGLTIERECIRSGSIVGTPIALLVMSGLYLLGLLHVKFRTCWRSLRTLTDSQLSEANVNANESTETTQLVRPSLRRQDLHSWAFIACGLIMAWTNLYNVIDMRGYSIKYQSNDNTENQLGYGQIVSLFIWVPVAVDFLYIAICEHSPTLIE